MGPPGAGKGTQAERVAERFAIPAISTGDIFRNNIKGGTDLGKQVEAILLSGGYVPDEMTNEIVKERLGWVDTAPGFLLDGYPRTVGQVEFLDEMLAASGHALDGVIELFVDEDDVVGRLLKRAQIEGRADDNEETIRERLVMYHTETAPLIELYDQHGILLKVDGMGTVDEVTDRVIKAVDSLSG
jgi:adenylate kinase